MKIALCDADKAYTREIKYLLYQYANKHRLDFTVDEYHSGQSLVMSREKYNLIFLEYNTDEISGLDAAKIIREEDSACTIIFISNYTGFILESFKVNPFRFLIKPVPDKLFYSTLDDYFVIYGKDFPLLIKEGDNTFCLSSKDIYYLEANNKHCFVNLKNDRIHCNKTMAKVFELLPKNHFLRINRAFVINFDYIMRFNNDAIMLTNGCNLHISRKYLKNFKEEYRNFLNPKMP